MHDPADEKKDEENESKQLASEEKPNDGEGEKQEQSTTDDITKPADDLSDEESKPQAMQIDDDAANQQQDDNDETMQDVKKEEEEKGEETIQQEESAVSAPESTEIKSQPEATAVPDSTIDDTPENDSNEIKADSDTGDVEANNDTIKDEPMQDDSAATSTKEKNDTDTPMDEETDTKDDANPTNGKLEESQVPKSETNGGSAESLETKSEPPDENGSHFTPAPAAATAPSSEPGSSQTAPATAATGTAPATPPPPPVLKGTLSYNVELRRHMIRGMWNYENSNDFPAQRFELLRNLDKDEDPTILPRDGEFHGSFSLAYYTKSSKGKQKERSKVIPESGVFIKFTPIEGQDGEYNVDGEGTNQFGVFLLNGTATPSVHEGDPTYDIELRKRYKPTPENVLNTAPLAAKKPKKRKSNVLGPAGETVDAADNDEGPLPPPSESYPSRVVCLRGKLIRDQSEDLGSTDIIHRITGMWATGLDLIHADPNNVRNLCNRFEYEHKSTYPNAAYPVSGRYTGWFDMTNEDGTRTRINEKDITLKFRKNNAGYHNVEGKGSNAYGKYNISGTLQDNIITIFRHFQPRKPKPRKDTQASGAVAARPVKKETVPIVEPKLKLADVIIPGGDKNEELLPLIAPPAHGKYSAVSRGIMRLNDDGAHTCSGKWAITREHFNNGTTSNFAFRLESHFAAEGAAAMNGGETTDGSTFPVDSHMYKGSFQMKRGTTKYTSIIDSQIVLKFRKNAEGSYNVYGKGINSIGQFDLTGRMILSGRNCSGHVELYRMYPLPPAVPGQPGPPGISSGSAKAATAKATSSKVTTEKAAVLGPLPSIPQPRPGLSRRESSRLVKLPSRLEDDDPGAQISRLLDKCAGVLKLIREKDAVGGRFFAQPVDPVALGLPTYSQIIREPMDLGTIQDKMDRGDIMTPEEFGRLVRLVFNNAITFNVEPTHIVHQAGRQLLIVFNQKFRDIERAVDNIRRQHKLPTAAAADVQKGGKQLKGGKKRKGAFEEMKSPKRMRLEEAQAFAATNANAMTELVAAAGAAGGTVSRSEFNMLLQMIKQMQGQVVQTHTLLANLSSDVVDETPGAVVAPPIIVPVPPPEAILPPMPEKKRPPKKEKVAPPPVDDSKPLTFEEQQQLTETINNLPADKLGGVINIIRESALFADDEEEIDLEIDQLDTVTQRKLQRYVKANVKPARGKKAKGGGKKQTKKSEPKPAPAPKKAQPPPAAPKQQSFFAFGVKDDDSDSESEGEINASNANAPAASAAPFSFVDDDAADDDDDNDEFGSGGFANWNVTTDKQPKDAAAADDDDWAGAREQAQVAKVREAERKAREDKLRAEAEEAKKQRLADAAARGEEVRAQREEDAANAAKLLEQKGKEAEEKKKAAREAEKAELKAVQQTVDLEEQRDIMKQFEDSYAPAGESDGASPSSDFGF